MHFFIQKYKEIFGAEEVILSLLKVSKTAVVEWGRATEVRGYAESKKSLRIEINNGVFGGDDDDGSCLCGIAIPNKTV